MQRKDLPPGEARAEEAAGGPQAGDTASRSRRRFGEGDTAIMRLDELLRGRPGRAAGGEGGHGETTQVVSVADLQLNLAHQTERTIRNAKLSEAQVALLQRTEPAASSQHTGSGVGMPATTRAGEAWRSAPANEAAPPEAPAVPTAPRNVGQLAGQEHEPPGVATRIGVLPANLSGARPGANKATATPPPAPVSAAATSAFSPWQPREVPRAAQASADGAAGERRGGPAPPPLPDGAPAQDWTREPPNPPPSARRTDKLPRSGGRDAATDPGIALPPGLAAPRGPAAVEQALADAASVGLGPTPVAALAQSKRRVANQVVVFFSCKGGSGATAMAANAAHAAVQVGQSACMFDLDLQLGDALAAFGLQPRFAVAQAIHLLAERQPLTRSLLPSHASGVHVLSQVGNLNDLEKITPETLSSLLLALRQQFETIVVDGVRDFGDNVLAILDGADKVAIVCLQEVLAIRRARWTFSILRKIGFDAADLTLIVNRYSAANEIPLSSISSMFEGAQVLPLAGDAALVTQSLNRGMPLAELRADAPLALDMQRLCGHIFFNDAVAHGQVEVATPVAQGSFLKRMFSGKNPRQPA